MKETMQRKIAKLTKAMAVDGRIYLYNREQIYSSQLKKVCTIHKLYHVCTVQEYMKTHPQHKKKKDQAFVRELVIDSFKQVDILLTLADLYKAGDG
jgi:hypothetical protein